MYYDFFVFSAEPLRLNGKVTGHLNDVEIVDSDLHGYIQVDQGRAFTAISRVPSTIGYDMQSLLAIGELPGWLFGSTSSGDKNGFSVTGGVFNRSVDIEFPQTGDKVFITETLSGLDVHNFLKMDVQIHGSVSSIAFGKKIEIDDYETEYTLVSQGIIRSRSSKSYRLEGNSIQVPYTVDQTIYFTECPYLPDEKRQKFYLLQSSRNTIDYNDQENIVRFAAQYNIESKPSKLKYYCCTILLIH